MFSLLHLHIINQKFIIMKTKLLSLMLIASVAFSNAQVLLSESFTDISTLAGWTLTNQSAPVGTSGWFQGNNTVFSAQSGAATAYIGANFNNTAGAGTISNWLITPQVMVKDGDVLKFWTQTSYDPDFADNLQVRSSTGATFTSPTSGTGLGSFTTLLLEINPTLSNAPGAYPDPWKEYTITISGVSGTPVAMNFAFRYFVTDAGPAGNNSNYMGIDTFSLTRPALAVSSANKAKVSIYPNPAIDYLNVTSASKISSVEIFDISGKKVSAELVDNAVDVQNLSKGAYVIKITDASGTTTQKFIKE